MKRRRPQHTEKSCVIRTVSILVMFVLAREATSFCFGCNTRPRFSPGKDSQFSRRTALRLRSSSDENQNVSEILFLERFRRRKWQMEQKVEQEEKRRPPNAELGPEETVREILLGLRQPHDPQRNFGLEILLRSCTASWREFLCKSVAATSAQDNTTIAAALEAAMSRPNNQFCILLGLENDGYKIDFPTDALDYGDGTCWIECRLRDVGKDKDELLVALGWSLVRDPKTSAWIVDGLDWQDFRDAYRPGIGREEWERICG